mgnify:CR=1 FL=1
MKTTEGSGKQEARSVNIPATRFPLPASRRTIGPQRARARVGCSRQWLTQLATQLSLGELRVGPYGRERWFNAAEIATMRAHRRAHPRTPRKEKAKS